MKSFAQFLKEGKNAEAIDEVKSTIRSSVDTKIQETRDSILKEFKFVNEEKDEEEKMEEKESEEKEKDGEENMEEEEEESEDKKDEEDSK